MRLITLKNTAEFDRVFDQGNRFYSGLSSIVVAQGKSATKVGLAVSKKIGNAVIRNRVKRIFREAFRSIAGNIITPAEIVVLPKPAAINAATQEVTIDLRTALFKAGLVGSR